MRKEGEEPVLAVSIRYCDRRKEGRGGEGRKRGRGEERRGRGRDEKKRASQLKLKVYIYH